MTQQAGRELDARVAEEVMEWKRVQQDLGEEWQNSEGRHVYGVESYHIRQVRGFHPSTDWSAVGEVLQCIRRHNENVQDQFFRALYRQWQRWRDADINKEYDRLCDNNTGRWFLLHADVPLSICLAALEAVRDNKGTVGGHSAERCDWDGIGTCPVCGEEVGRIL